MKTLQIQLPEAVAAELEKASREDSRPPAEMARDLLKRALAVRRFERTRSQILDTLGPEAPNSDDEVFRQIS